MAKNKVPKGTQNLDCLNLLPDFLFNDAIEEGLGQARKGDEIGRGFFKDNMEELEYQKQKLAMHLYKNKQLTLAIKHPNGPYRGAQAVLRPDPFDTPRNSPSIESRAQAIRGKLSSVMNETLDAFRPRHLGFSRDREGMRNVVREIRGVKTGDQDAAQYAQGWKMMADYVRKRYIAGGARIGKLEDWGMPQYHDAEMVARVSAYDWATSTMAKLDFERMNAELNMTRQQMFDLLTEEIYPSIITNGAHKIDLSKVYGGKSSMTLLDQLAQSRFMHFKSPDDWLEYQDQFGSPDYLTAMVDFMDRSALNLAAIEVLGPDPDIGFNHLRNLMKKRLPPDKVAGANEKLDMLYDNVMGKVGVANVKMAKAFAGIRAFNVAAHLGNATLSMITDPAFMAMTARVNGLSPVKTLMRQLKMSVEAGVGGSRDHRFAAQIGFAAEYAMDRMIASARFTDNQPTKMMRRLSEITMRASWLHSITVAGRAAFQLEYAAALAKESKTAFKDLSKERLAAFNRVGITEADWEVIRDSQKVRKGNVDYVDANQIGIGGNMETVNKLYALIQQETSMAVPTPGAEVRAVTNQGLARGTWSGEGMRSVGEFKSFPISIMLTHFRRNAQQTTQNKWAYRAQLFLALSALGYVAYATKEIQKGRDVPSMTNEDGTPNMEVIFKSLMQGGGLGIYGDFLFNDYSRFGMSLGQQLAGPTVGTVGDAIGVGQAAIKAGHEAIMSDDDDAYKKLMSRIGDKTALYMPSVWQTQALQMRAINKALNATIDPERERKLSRAEKRRQKQQGQENFWAEDEWLPSRPPGMAEGGPGY